MKLQSLPTSYRGVTFRSRLEADYAATLDDRGVKWLYEPEGFQLSTGDWYAPDFYLPGAKAWLEVKGAHEERVWKVDQFAADLWADSPCTVATDLAAPMVLLGTAPEGFRMAMLGVRGPGRGYSVLTASCDSCGEGTVIALWADHCRNCGALSEDPWADVHWGWDRPFVRAPRPFGLVR